MKDATIYIKHHPLAGTKMVLNKKEFTIGSIWLVDNTKRLYIEMKDDGTTINYPLHEITKRLFDENTQSTSREV